MYILNLYKDGYSYDDNEDHLRAVASSEGVHREFLQMKIIGGFNIFHFYKEELIQLHEYKGAIHPDRV